MKKLNNKGFTLIELLAVIVILAIIMVVTIPTVLSSIDNARKQTFFNSANVVAEWVEKQYALSQFEMADSAFLGVCNNDNADNLSGDATYIKNGNGTGYCKTRPYNSAYMVSRANTTAANKNSYRKKISVYLENTTAQANTQKLITMLKAAGVNPDNYGSVRISINDSGRACVRLTASEDGDFKNFLVTSVDTDGYIPKPDDAVAYSTGC